MGDAGVGWIAAIIIGGIAGWLAEQFMKSNMGMIMNIVLGIAGAAIASAILTISGLFGADGLATWFPALSARSCSSGSFGRYGQPEDIKPRQAKKFVRHGQKGCTAK
jgi:uncharacterized membrane protein YeaQ/YmgE (transglycosylase-associated protein family)